MSSVATTPGLGGTYSLKSHSILVLNTRLYFLEYEGSCFLTTFYSTTNTARAASEPRTNSDKRRRQPPQQRARTRCRLQDPKSRWQRRIGRYPFTPWRTTPAGTHIPQELSRQCRRASMARYHGARLLPCPSRVIPVMQLVYRQSLATHRI